VVWGVTLSATKVLESELLDGMIVF